MRRSGGGYLLSIGSILIVLLSMGGVTAAETTEEEAFIPFGDGSAKKKDTQQAEPGTKPETKCTDQECSTKPQDESCSGCGNECKCEKGELEVFLDVGIQGSTFSEGEPQAMGTGAGTPDPMAAMEDTGLFNDPQGVVGIRFRDLIGRHARVLLEGGITFQGVNVELGSGTETDGEEILRDTKAATLGLGLGWRIPGLHTNRIKTYFGAEARGYSPTDATETVDFLSEYGAFLRARVTEDVLKNSYIQVLRGRSDRFVEKDRWIVGAHFEGDIGAEGAYSVLADFDFNFDGSDGSDDLRVTFGMRYEFLAKWKIKKEKADKAKKKEKEILEEAEKAEEKKGDS